VTTLRQAQCDHCQATATCDSQAMPPRWLTLREFAGHAPIGLHRGDFCSWACLLEATRQRAPDAPVAPSGVEGVG
jgi:hypothetical protein